MHDQDDRSPPASPHQRQTGDALGSDDSVRIFHQLIESLPMVAVQGYNSQRQVIYWNEASRRLYGYTREEAQGQLLEDLIIPEDIREGVIAAHHDWLHHDISIPSEEIFLRHKDGHLILVYSSHVMIRNDKGEREMFCIDVSMEAQRQANERLRRIASIDDLTQLPTRRLMEDELAARIAASQRRQEGQVAVVFIDLDNFKLINDTLGHHCGDRLLHAVAGGLKAEVRDGDLLSRFGGDEFVLLLFDYDGVEGIHELLQRLIGVLDRGFVLDGVRYQVTASFGVSLFPDDGATPAELMGNADAAMYQAKDAGRNRICFYTSDINNRLVHYQQMTALLRGALANEGLALYLQPQIDLNSGSITSCEALLRCFDDNHQVVSPSVFIPIAEKSGLIHQIGDWVIKTACQQLAAWRGTALDNMRIDINLSGRQLANSNLAGFILQSLSKYDLPPSRLGVELTENEVIGQEKEQIGQLETLKQAGVHISIDDFGTGYSSLVYLQRLPVSSLKIDRGFLHNAINNDGDMAIMEAIITVGHRLGLGVVVEGVETTEQDQLVKDLGCDLAQGFLYARPMPEPEIAAFLASQVPPSDH